MASSSSLPIVGCFALLWRCAHLASFGTQKTLSARYSSVRSQGPGRIVEEQPTAKLEHFLLSACWL